jgi:hypothetical protein
VFLPAATMQLLRTRFGFDRLREGQEEVISRLLEGKSVLAIFPTGAGKSLCYQLPALQLDGLTVVVSPLIALMKDQLDFLQSKRVPAARLDSSLAASVSAAEDATAGWRAQRATGGALLGSRDARHRTLGAGLELCEPPRLLDAIVMLLFW